MDYRAKMPKEHEVIIQALRSCERINGCDDCPYAIESNGCRSLTENTISLLMRQAKEIEQLKGRDSK